jgi:hypothetical protein
MGVYVNDTGNSVNVNTTFNTVNVLPDQNSTIIEVITPGPQGARGEPGDPNLLTGSFVSTSSFFAFTSSYNTGSFTGSFIGDGSKLIGTSPWTGSNPITAQANVEITGSFNVTNQSGTSLFLINTQGVIIENNASNIFLIKNQNSINVFTVSQSGIIVVATQSVELTSPAPNGGIYFTSNSLFIGLD